MFGLIFRAAQMMVMKNKDSQEYLQSQRKMGKTFTFDR